MSAKLQRAKLEADFNDLMKSAPVSVKQTIQSELDSTSGDTGDLDIEDEHLILDDYASDDGKKDEDSDDEEKEEEVVHCTKVNYPYLYETQM